MSQAQQLMSREDAMLGLLRLEPLNADELHDICGWPFGESGRVLAELLQAGRVRRVMGDMRRRYIAADT